MACAIAEKNPQLLGIEGRNGQIRGIIFVKIADGYGVRPRANGKINCCSKAAGTVAQQYRHIVTLAVNDCEIRFFVAVEISHGNLPRKISCREHTRSAKSTCAVIEKN